MAKKNAGSDAWKKNLVRTRDGFAACQSNINTIFANEPAWAGVLAYNEFTAQTVKLKPPPWYPDDCPSGTLTGPWGDSDSVCAAAWVTREWNDIRPSDLMVEKAIHTIAKKNLIHPVRDRLKALVWDATPRLDTWLIRLGGAEDNLYTRAVSAMFIISAVARAFQPGCKVDHTLVLEGPQGIGKSTLLKVLATEEWFLETGLELGSKDSYQALHGKWIVELAELDSLNRSEVTRVKSFLTACVDSYRPSYGRSRVDFPRQCVFAGTTNEDEYLKDDTGGRRFWPVRLSKCDVKTLRKESSQLWAEAVVRYKAKEAWHITNRKLSGLFEAEQEWRRQHDPWESTIAKWLARSPRRWERGTTTADIMEHALDLHSSKHGRFEQMRVGAILRKLGWTRARVRTSGCSLEYAYTPSPEALARLRAADAPSRAAETVAADGKLAHMIDHLRNKGSRKTPLRPPAE